MRKQQGISFIGFIFIAVLIALAALVGFKVTPVYVEYFAVKKILNGTAMEAKESSPTETRRLFERKLSADYVDAVQPADLEINKENGQIVLSVSYTRKIPLAYNVSLFFEFDVSARR